MNRRVFVSLPSLTVTAPKDDYPAWSDARHNHQDDVGNGFAEFKARNLRLLFNGEDVTQFCFYYDRRAGIVGLYDQPLRSVGGVVALRWRKGKIQIAESA